MLTKFTFRVRVDWMNGLQTISIKDAREQFSDLVNQVAIAKKQFVITKFGKPRAKVVPIDEKKTKKRFSGLEASFGAWKDRTDIKDSAKWVAKQRKKWNRYDKIFS